mmetsp:Transcript_93697/g.265326  ORF Transcript_93697/g.265326 Transcript_93697/m.265326 type:complete len:489 (-) Transcript_93697:843-2309(-)
MVVLTSVVLGQVGEASQLLPAHGAVRLRLLLLMLQLRPERMGLLGLVPQLPREEPRVPRLLHAEGLKVCGTLPVRCQLLLQVRAHAVYGLDLEVVPPVGQQCRLQLPARRRLGELLGFLGLGRERVPRRLRVQRRRLLLREVLLLGRHLRLLGPQSRPICRDIRLQDQQPPLLGPQVLVVGDVRGLHALHLGLRLLELPLPEADLALLLGGAPELLVDLGLGLQHLPVALLVVDQLDLESSVVLAEALRVLAHLVLEGLALFGLLQVLVLDGLPGLPDPLALLLDRLVAVEPLRYVLLHLVVGLSDLSAVLLELRALRRDVLPVAHDLLGVVLPLGLEQPPRPRVVPPLLLQLRPRAGGRRADLRVLLHHLLVPGGRPRLELLEPPVLRLVLRAAPRDLRAVRRAAPRELRAVLRHLLLVRPRPLRQRRMLQPGLLVVLLLERLECPLGVCVRLRLIAELGPHALEVISGSSQLIGFESDLLALGCST